MRDCPLQARINGELSCLFGAPGKHRTTEKICSRCFVRTLSEESPDGQALNICYYLDLELSISLAKGSIQMKTFCIKRGTTGLRCSDCRFLIPTVVKGGVRFGEPDAMERVFLFKRERLLNKLNQEISKGV